MRDLSGGNADVIALVHATVNLIENLGMASLAEGVENPRQVAILQSLGCRYAQGYFFGRPVLGKDYIECAEAAAQRRAFEPA
jgi:EAL domain-containing protein (putative c-di-GMP-specific phosphodiesterase class I)